ncbi:MAG: TonB-dependent receptor [Ferruginibacter sp.]
MKKSIVFIGTLFIGYYLPAQQKNIIGFVCDSLSKQPVDGATVIVNPGSRTEITDETGRFVIRDATSFMTHVIISAIGFQSRNLYLVNGLALQTIKLVRQQTKLADVVVTASSKNPYKALAETDIEMRGVANSQEVLRMVPGLFIGQHQGGGKAEQIFLRGFDADHGTDISIHADGIPVNMVSHAHGQGYADSHFIIPETIERATFNKGPYDAEKGDMATSGYLDFNTANSIPNNTIKLEAGQFHTYRALGMVNLLGEKAKVKHQSWYIASEYSFSNSYFDDPQHFKRFNFFTKFNYKLSGNQALTISASKFHSSWFACGQIPERAIDSGLVSYYGALDRNEGGVTGRTNVNILLSSSLSNGDLIKNQLYYSRYKFDLHSNFTFFLIDSVNGDEIRQREARNLLGYNGSYEHKSNIGSTRITSRVGINIRLDATEHTELSHTRNRYTLLNEVKLGNIIELGTGIYINETIRFNNRWYVDAGLRFDQFNYSYDNLFAGDATLKKTGVYKAANHIFSPKLSVNYQADRQTEFYCSVGKGFHTNDARVVVAEPSQTLPAAYGADLGIVYKPFRNLLVHAACWYIYLRQEYVYAGDGATVDFSGRTQRFGIDLSTRYQPVRFIFVDVDLNVAHGRSLGEEKGNNYIPLAPAWSSSAGINFINKVGWNAGIRYRYLSKRPANENYSLTCEGYFVNDLVIKHKRPRYEYGLIINNLFNVQWRETQFETVTRLKNEQSPVDGISFTPGTKFAAKISASYFFGGKSIDK